LLRLKNAVLKNKIKISKKMMKRLAIFAIVIGSAFVFDTYLNTESSFIINSEENSQQEKTTQSTIYLVNQVNAGGLKLSFPKINNRHFQLVSHDKYLQKYHQIRNYQVLKAEVQTQTAPLILSYHYLVFQNYFFSFPDDVPLFA
jgi:hypothetical protein